jgi:hypothetical protein
LLVIDRFQEKVKLDNNGCWVWKASRTTGGYGKFWFDGKLWLAHRWSYEYFVNQIPEGLDLDHLCRNRACVNPDHLEAVTKFVNMSRGIKWQALKTHCKHGHEFTPENTKIRSDGNRYCRACGRVNQATYDRKRRSHGRAEATADLPEQAGNQTA